MAKEKKSHTKLILFLVVFLDLVGFGIFITLSPFLARYFAASEFQIGLLMASYSIMQFLFSPFWGKLSDRYGRRPILLMSLVGGSLSYLGIAFSTSLTSMFIFRSLAGLFAANISTAHAAIADVTPREQRTSAMGLIGAAFGLGFIVGPSLGSLFGYIGKQIGETAPFGIFFPALMAFVITLLNFLWAYFWLPETLGSRTDDETTEITRPNFKPQTFLVNYLIGLYFIACFAMPLMEVMLFPFVSDRFQWDFVKAGMGFAVVGLVMAFTQGVLVKRLMPRFGERKLLLAGLLLMAISFLMISYSETISFVGAGMFVLAIGNGFMRPSSVGIISVLSKETEQGRVMGLTQSSASLGRILGPICGGWLYTNLSMTSPFTAASIVSLVGFMAAAGVYRLLPGQRSRT